MDLGSQAAGIGALAEDTRRALYEYVCSRGDAVGREEAASAVGVAQHNANFHLDRLVDEGLLDVEFRRLSGRTGPGAGRPSKLYRRAAREFSVALPPRRYDLVGDILASAVTRVGQGTSLDAALVGAAREEGERLGAEAPASGERDALQAVADTLGPQGYEPRVEEAEVVLANCPFDALAQRHTDLVCGLNRDFVEGVTIGMGCAGLSARLEPHDEQCCVRIREQ